MPDEESRRDVPATEAFGLAEMMNAARNAYPPPPMPPGGLPEYGMLSRRAHPLLYPLAEIHQIVDQLRPLFVCGHGIVRTEQEAPSYPRLIRAALLEIQDRIPKAIAELDKMEAKKE